MADPLFPAAGAPDGRVAIGVAGDRWTYADLAAEADGHAAWLRKAGVEPGARVAVWADRHPRTPWLLAQNALAGVVSVPLNPDLGATELAHILRDAAPRLVLAAQPEVHVEATPNAVAPPVPSRARPRPLAPFDPYAPVVLLYTSGTTGAPKGVALTARNIASNLDALAEAWGITANDTVVHALPLFHVHGLVLGLFGALRAGASFTWVPRFEPAALAGAMAGPSRVLYAVPTIIHRLGDHLTRSPADAEPFARARLLVSGSAALSVREHARFERLTGRGVIERYGLTETLINCALRDGEVRPGCVGRALSGTDVWLVDDARQPIPQGDEHALGEVAVRGPNVFAGYLGRPEATREVLVDGVFYTGDLATRSRDGHFRIAGRRATDLIKTGGFKVGAGEVEACLLAQPGVREAAVVGVPDDDLGERIVAFVVPESPSAPPAPEALCHAVEDSLARHKRPREVRFVAELPRNAMGKVLKGALRADDGAGPGRNGESAG